MIDHLLDRVNCLLDVLPAHLVALVSIGAVTFGLWTVIGLFVAIAWGGK